jgi:hypothetical protein
MWWLEIALQVQLYRANNANVTLFREHLHNHYCHRLLLLSRTARRWLLLSALLLISYSLGGIVYDTLGHPMLGTPVVVVPAPFNG